MQGFSQFLAEAQGMGVPFLYPLGYQGVGQYPPEYLAALFPDALIYIAADERLQKCWEAEPFKIDHLKPQPIFNKKYGKLSLVSTHPKIPEGKTVPWKSLPPDPDQKLYPAGPAHPCMISEPKCLPPNLADKEAEKFGDPCHGKWKLPEHKMKKFNNYLQEARKMSKSNSQNYHRIECEDCERVYYVPNDEYEKRRVGRSRLGKYIQFPDEDCPYCRYENEMDDDDTGRRRSRYGDHTGYAEGVKNEYAPLVGALPGQVPISGYRPDTGVVAQEPLIPDEFPQKSVVTDKKAKIKKPKINEVEKMPMSFLQFAEMMDKKQDLVPSDKLSEPMKKPYQDYRAFDELKVLHDKKKQKALNKFE
jgi:hypothetical protein